MSYSTIKMSRPSDTHSKRWGGGKRHIPFILENATDVMMLTAQLCLASNTTALCRDHSLNLCALPDA